MPTLHVVIPSYNERDTLVTCLDRVAAVEPAPGWTTRLWVVDDHSDDDTHAIARGAVDRLSAAGTPAHLERHAENRGKGAALQTGFDLVLASGAADDDVVIVQDADLEYDPADYPALLEPLRSGRADAVVGSRWSRLYRRATVKRHLHAIGNQALSWLSGLMTGLWLSDMECCYKLMPVRVLRSVRPWLDEERFGIEPQMVAIFSALGLRVAEVPITYAPRNTAAGKKIGWRDGVHAIRVIARERRRNHAAGDGRA